MFQKMTNTKQKLAYFWCKNLRLMRLNIYLQNDDELRTYDF